MAIAPKGKSGDRYSHSESSDFEWGELVQHSLMSFTLARIERRSGLTRFRVMKLMLPHSSEDIFPKEHDESYCLCSHHFSVLAAELGQFSSSSPYRIRNLAHPG